MCRLRERVLQQLGRRLDLPAIFVGLQSQVFVLGAQRFELSALPLGDTANHDGASRDDDHGGDDDGGNLFLEALPHKSAG